MVILAPNGRYRLGVNTLANMEGVHPWLVEIAKQAIQLTTVDFCVLPGGGLRSHEQAEENAARGTGVKNSLHIRQHTGYSHAVDLVAYVGKPTWEPLALYREIRAAVLQAAGELGYPVQHGADWDIDGITGERGEYDWPHWQIPNLPHRRKAALEQLNSTRTTLSLPGITEVDWP